MCTSMREPTASAIAGSARMLDSAPSSWRPPWLLTISASAPLSTASCASSTSRMPLRISLPPQRFLIHSTSSQLRRGSNCLAVHSDSELDVRRRPSRGRRCCRSCAASCRACRRHQRGLVARLIMLASVGFGGADRPFFRSLWRWPRICRSSVSTSARAAGGLGAVDQALDEVAVAHHVELEPERLRRGAGDVLDRADAHRRQRERDAELLRRARGEDLAVGVLHAGQPDRRDRHRHRDVGADHRRADACVGRCRPRRAGAAGSARSRPRSRGRCSRSTSRSRRSRRTCAARAASRAGAGLRCR